MAYFYFDFRDANKQSLRDLIPSFLTQLSARSGPRCDILSNLYSAHDQGKNQPSDSILVECLKEMLTLPDQPPTYLIIDALDESPNTSGIPSARERVLGLLKDLIDLHLPNLHICVTSRPEIDVRNVIGPLTSLRVSLHDQSGQKKDIEDYVRSVVYSDSEPIIRRWRKEDKELVIEVLSERADGMYVNHFSACSICSTLSNRFRWIFCQLEVLRHCLPPSVRHTLEELPEALDETYERMLWEIKKPNRDHARRLLRCLVVAIRSLRVEELAEVLAVDFDDADGSPKLKPIWRWEDQEQALLASCSSLIAIVDTEHSRIVQFSHFSVKQFLTSERLATSSQNFSRYYIDLEPAHIVMAQACLSVLLQPDDPPEDEKRSPLAGYAAEHWANHAQLGRVSTITQEMVERLFERDRAHFVAWIKAYNLDQPQESPLKPSADPVPLYYAALCGSYDIAERLLVTRPQDINARGGRRVTALHAALDMGHVGIAELLLQHGADVSARDGHDQTPSHLAAEYGYPEVLRSLIDHGANPNVQNKNQETPLFMASRMGRLEAAQLLSDHGADINHQDSLGRTPLHIAAENGHYEVARLLLDYGADDNALEKDSQTSLHLHLVDNLAVAQSPLKCGAEVDARDKMGCTPLHFASRQGHQGLVQLLLEHHADVLARNHEDQTFLDIAWAKGHKEIVDVNARYEDGWTALHIASQHGDPELMCWLIDREGDPRAEDDDHETPLFPASRNGKLEAAQLLLDAGADANHRDWQEMTPLHGASENGHVAVTQLLLKHNAAVNARHVYGWTPLHLASRAGKGRVAEVLLDGGATVNAQNDSDWTPLHMASQKGHLNVVELLLDRGADMNLQEADGETALHLAAFYGHFEVAQVLLKNDADLLIKNKEGETPLDLALKERHHDIAQLLEGHGFKKYGEKQVAEKR